MPSTLAKTLGVLLSLSAFAYADRTVTSWRTTTSWSTLSKTSTTTKTVTAQPTCTAAQYESFTVNYDFDTIQGATGTSLTEIQEYNLLYFSFNLVSILAEAVGTIPHTANNVAAFAAATEVQDGTPSISANYEESTIDHFTAHSWYYACVVASEETAASPPVDCNITATGFDKSGSQVASQVFQFHANPPLNNMVMGTFSSSFQNLWHIDLAVTSDTTTAAQIDDFIATLYQLPSAPYY